MLAVGDPAQQIVALAHREQMDLIVMPTHGYGRFRKLILGSVTAKVLNDADCRVWTGVHLEESSRTEWKSIRTIICAVDRNIQAPKVLQWARDFAHEFDSAIVVVHAVSQFGASSRVRLASELRAEAEQHFHCLLRELGILARVHVETSEVTDVVGWAAENFGADFLIIGRSSERGIEGRLVDHSYALIRRSQCPVVSI
jgi:nucleotide-binding universal stress UspA family protein